MKLTHLSVTGLFHTFNYKFSVPEDNQAFLITGPNGYGKTTILTILDSLYKRDLFYFYSLPFEEINLEFDLGVSILLTSSEQKKDTTVDTARQGERTIVFEWKQNQVTMAELHLTNKIYRDAIRIYNSANERRPFYEKKPFATLEEYFVEETRSWEMLFKGQESALMFLMQLQTLNITFQKSNRLTQKVDSEGNVVESIDQISAALKEIMAEAYLKYLKEVNHSNNGLYDKLLINQEPLDRIVYEKKAAELSAKILQLYNWGLTTEKTIRSYEEKHAEVLTIYMEELERNIKIYDKLYSQLGLFERMLNEKMFSHKQIRFNPNHGITAIMDFDSYPLDLIKLSSGEQHEIIMLFNAIFNTNRDSILLIDEPENSLHVAWQNTFVSDINEICGALNAQVIIATHSPQIIGRRYKECFDLFEAQEG